METNTPHYEASKISDRKWGVFYRLDERTSFGPDTIWPTKRRAVAMAAMMNRDHAAYVAARKQEEN
jgi:hypothetical protein